MSNNAGRFILVIIIIAIVCAKCDAKSVERTLQRKPTNHRLNADGFVFPSDGDNDNIRRNNFHQHLHHHQGHSSNLENYEQPLIPLDLIQRYNNLSEVNDLLLNLVEGNVDFDLENRFGFGVERSAAITPKAAVCMPELQTVKIVPEDDPSVLFIPSCTRIERCGGCCSHSLLSCQPKDVETVSYQVVKTQFLGGNKLNFMGKEVVLVERHLKCKCDCKIKESDCNSLQVYKKTDCRCACTNLDEERKCYKENVTKLWNPELCACECRNIMPCSTGYTFDNVHCRCVPMPMRRRYVDNQEFSHKGEDVPLEPPIYEVKNIVKT